MIVINSYDVAVELFEKKFMNYSDRPNSVMVNELYVTIIAQISGPLYTYHTSRQRWDWMLSSLSYGEEHKKLRAPVQKFFESSNIQQFEDIQKDEVQKL